MPGGFLSFLEDEKKMNIMAFLAWFNVLLRVSILNT